MSDNDMMNIFQVNAANTIEEAEPIVELFIMAYVFQMGMVASIIGKKFVVPSTKECMDQFAKHVNPDPINIGRIQAVKKSVYENIEPTPKELSNDLTAALSQVCHSSVRFDELVSMAKQRHRVVEPRFDFSKGWLDIVNTERLFHWNPSMSTTEIVNKILLSVSADKDALVNQIALYMLNPVNMGNGFNVEMFKLIKPELQLARAARCDNMRQAQPA
jgi:hypothetical protein